MERREIWRSIRIGEEREGGVRRWKTPEEEEGKVRRDTDNRDPHVSGSGRKERGRCGTRARARGDGLSGRDLGSAHAGANAGGGSGPRCGLRESFGPKRKIPFLFFKLFKAKFQRIFKSKFEFDQTTHLKNLNATA
jgi:hypothetical protein